MSQKIAPGAWDPEKRQDAKRLVQLLGTVAMAVGIVVGSVVAVRPEPSIVGLIFAAVLVLAGLICLIPNVAMPLAYRLIDKFMRDTPGDG